MRSIASLRGVQFLLVLAGALSGCTEQPPPAARAPDSAAAPAAPTGGAKIDPATAPASRAPLDGGPTAERPRSPGDGGAAPAASAAGRAKCPSEMAPIPAGGCIDRWEASAGSGAAGKPDGKGVTMRARSVAGQPPLVRVSIFQARAMCRNAGKRLCGEREWASACQGARGWRYPYANDFEPERCNDWEHSGHGRQHTVATGAMPGCVSPNGVYDLANNAAEWVEPDQLEPGAKLEVRGGTYNMTVVDSQCDEDDYRVAPLTQAPDIGFRCCRKSF